MRQDIPVIVIGGYLGAGKTTLLNHLLRHADGRKIAILVNEFGDLPIDVDLIEAKDDEMIAISGGCICCSFGSDMTAALIKLAQLEHACTAQEGVPARVIAIPGSRWMAQMASKRFSSESIMVRPNAAMAGSDAASSPIRFSLSRLATT